MKSNKGAAIVDPYDSIHTKLIDAGLVPVLQYLDNEVSKELIQSIKSKHVKYQLVAPYDHCLNPVKRAIQTFKNHFVVILADCDSCFLKYLWCQLVPQAVLTLNMLRQSRINPKLSAHDQVFGTFNFQQTLLAPLGTNVRVRHE